MTLLDDYEVPYKLRGTSIISRMLKSVPPDLLRRTGIDELIFSVRFLSVLGSWKGGLSHPVPVSERNARIPTQP